MHLYLLFEAMGYLAMWYCAATLAREHSYRKKPITAIASARRITKLTIPSSSA